MPNTEIVPESAHNMTLVGHSDQGGRGDCLQVMVARGHAYIGTRVSRGINVTDVRDPRHPKPVNFVPTHPNSVSMHLQAADDLLLHIQEADQRSLLSAQEYYGGSGRVDSRRFGTRGQDYAAGMTVYDIKDPANPRRIGFLEVEGLGIHRIWWIGGRYAYASALLDGFIDHILIVIDMADPTKPRECGRWWIPGMHAAAGETPGWSNRYALHHAIVRDDFAYGAWRDGGLTILDVKDKSAPKLIAHRTWSPPFGGGTHNCLPLTDRNLLIVLDEAVLDNMEDGFKPIWVFDNQVKSNPISVSTFPLPNDRDYVAVGGHFGPHNIHENRPGSFQSSTLVFATYQNAGVRVYDITDPFRPVEVGACVPPAPKKLVDPRPNRPIVLHSADVFVDKNGLCYCTDWSGAGLHIMEYLG